MSVDIEDRTGMPETVAEYDEVIEVVRKFVVIGITKFPPEFAVHLPGILRCLEQGRTLTRFTEEMRKKKQESP